MAADAKAKTATKKAAARRKAATKDSQFRNFTPYKPKRSEEYLSEGQLDHLRGILSQWRTQLMEEVDRTVNHMQDDAANFPDPVDRASQEEEFSIELDIDDIIDFSSTEISATDITGDTETISMGATKTSLHTKRTLTTMAAYQ